MSVTIAPNRAELKRLEKSLDGLPRKLNIELKIAVGKTLRFVQSQKAKAIASEINMTQRDIKKEMRKKMPTKQDLVGVSTLLASRRPSLKRFKPRQTKKGTSFRIKKGGGVSSVPGAFMGPRPGVMSVRLGGHVFKRLGKERLPIVKLHGVSPWGVYVKNNMTPVTKKQAEQRLNKEIAERARVNALRKAGLI